MSKYLYLTVILVVSSVYAFGQANFGEIRGKIIDGQTKKALDYAEIIVKKDGIAKGGGLSDDVGNYTVKPLDPGEYVVEITYVGYNTRQYSGVVVTGNNISYVNVELSPAKGGEKLTTVTVTRYKTNLIEPDKNQKSFSDKDLVKMAVRSAGGLAATSSAANTTASGGVSFLGQRTDATRVFIDGVAVIGDAGIPQGAQSQVDIIQSGVPAQYGDFTGGAINYTTKGPSRYVRKSFEVISSSLFDPYHYNYAQGFMSGPLWIKNKGGGDKEYVALGFQLSGDVNYTKDPSPLYGGVYVVKDDVLDRIEKNP
ncbi:MAG: hypothetical protein ACI9UJ_002131, partial [bacterium]